MLVSKTLAVSTLAAGLKGGLRGALLLAALAPALALAACSYRGDIDAAPTIKFTWFSYLNGDDIREACQPGTAFRYRLIYNADYAQQVRVYEVAPHHLSASGPANGGGAAFVTRVSRGSGIRLDSFSINNPLALGGFTQSDGVLDPEALAELDHALEWSAAYQAAPKGLRLYSDQYYWVSALCRDGRFYFNAWLYPSERYDFLSFPAVLYAHDNSGVPVAPPKDVGPAARMKGAHKGQPANQIFQIRVGENGLAGLAGL